MQDVYSQPVLHVWTKHYIANATNLVLISLFCTFAEQCHWNFVLSSRDLLTCITCMTWHPQATTRYWFEHLDRSIVSLVVKHTFLCKTVLHRLQARVKALFIWSHLPGIGWSVEWFWGMERSPLMNKTRTATMFSVLINKNDIFY